MDQQWAQVDKRIMVKIDCIVYGNPAPEVSQVQLKCTRGLSTSLKQVTWFNNSAKIFETDTVLMTVKSTSWSLKLRDLNTNDFGNYSCQATNSLGTVRGYSLVTGKICVNRA